MLWAVCVVRAHGLGGVGQRHGLQHGWLEHAQRLVLLAGALGAAVCAASARWWLVQAHGSLAPVQASSSAFPRSPASTRPLLGPTRRHHCSPRSALHRSGSGRGSSRSTLLIGSRHPARLVHGHAGLGGGARLGRWWLVYIDRSFPCSMVGSNALTRSWLAASWASSARSSASRS